LTQGEGKKGKDRNNRNKGRTPMKENMKKKKDMVTIRR
jgi:hypothetical protein